MAQNTDLDDMTFDVARDDDDFPTQNGTKVNNFEEEQRKKPLAVADVADRIAGKNKKVKVDSSIQKKAILMGAGFGIFIFSIIVFLDVMMKS